MSAPAESEASKPALRGHVAQWLREAAVSLAAVALALLVGAVLIVVSDADVLATWGYFFAYPPDALQASWSAVADAYGALLRGSLGGWRPLTGDELRYHPARLGGTAPTYEDAYAKDHKDMTRVKDQFTKD